MKKEGRKEYAQFWDVRGTQNIPRSENIFGILPDMVPPFEEKWEEEEISSQDSIQTNFRGPSGTSRVKAQGPKAFMHSQPVSSKVPVQSEPQQSKPLQGSRMEAGGPKVSEFQGAKVQNSFAQTDDDVDDFSVPQESPEGGPYEKKIVVDRVRTKGDLRLILEVDARLPSGNLQPLKVLVDTGAETNLIREGLVSPVEFLPAKHHLCLTTANGQRLRGGRNIFCTDLKFNRISSEGDVMEGCSLRAKFFEADINADVILGHPWLRTHQIGVFPHVKALALINGEDRVDWLWGRDYKHSNREEERGEDEM